MHAPRPQLQPAPVDGPFCRNCGARAEVNYCPVCGQETRIELPTVGHFVAEFAEQTFALQGQLWRTLHSLLLKPGELTLQYVAGRRQRYVRPLRLYLALSILFFAALGLSSKTDWVTIDPEEASESTVADKPATVAPPPAIASQPDPAPPKPPEPQGSTAAEKTRPLGPDDVHVETGYREFDARVNHRMNQLRALPKEEIADRIFDTFTTWAPAAMFFLMPLFAAFLKLGYLRRGAHYAVHLLFAVNFHSFMFLMLLIGLLPLIDPFSEVLLSAIPLHLWLALRRVHGGGGVSTAFFVFLLFVVYAVAMALVMALATVVPLALL